METPEYFDNVTIGQFALTDVPTKVYVNNRYLSITDPDDVEDASVGFGMDENSEMHPFDYRLVQHLLVGDQVIDLETFKKASEDESDAKDDSKGEDKKTGEEDKGEDKESDKDKGDEKDKEEKNPFESILKLKSIVSELTKDEFDAQQDSLEAEMDAGKAKIDAAKKKLADLKKQPIEEAAKPKFVQGDIIQNTDKECGSYGAIGVVQKVYKDDDIENVVYRITNNGPMFKTGDLSTNRADQLKAYSKDDLMPDPELPEGEQVKEKK
jgi:hypothetical protein